MTQNLFENWDATKGALTDGLEGNKKVVMESVLENLRATFQNQPSQVQQWQVTLLHLTK